MLHYNLALIYYNKEEYQDVVKHLNKSLELDLNNYHSYYLLGFYN
jgi:tetratricopeptide (TPR) repeat protein